jgi:hypothetical protein
MSVSAFFLSLFFKKNNHFIVLWGRGPYVGHNPVRGGLAPALIYRRYEGMGAGVLSIENEYSECQCWNLWPSSAVGGSHWGPHLGWPSVLYMPACVISTN